MTRIAKFPVLFKKMRSAEVMGMIQKYFNLKKFQFLGTSFYYVLYRFSEAATGGVL